MGARRGCKGVHLRPSGIWKWWRHMLFYSKYRKNFGSRLRRLHEYPQLLFKSRKFAFGAQNVTLDTGTHAAWKYTEICLCTENNVNPLGKVFVYPSRIIGCTPPSPRPTENHPAGPHDCNGVAKWILPILAHRNHRVWFMTTTRSYFFSESSSYGSSHRLCNSYGNKVQNSAYLFIRSNGANSHLPFLYSEHCSVCFFKFVRFTLTKAKSKLTLFCWMFCFLLRILR